MMNIAIRPFTDDDYEGFAALRNAVYPEYPFSVADWQHADKHRDPKCRFARFVAEQDGLIVGMCNYANMTWMYHPQKFYVDVSVHPEYQRQGIGRRLSDHLIRQMKAFEPLVLRTEVREDKTRDVRFVQQYDFVEELRIWESRLDLQSFDLVPFAHDLKRPQQYGITIKSFRELEADPQHYQKLHMLLSECEQDVPAPDPITTVPYDVWLESTRNSPALMPDAYLIALDGDEYVGLSQLWKREGSADLDNGLTGVKRAYRRKGIALALKLQNILYAKQQGYAQIKTSNESTNRPMLSINERLGFVKQPAWINFVKKLRDEQ
jgi:GNAT superfamily N-acetyltransferase